MGWLGTEMFPVCHSVLCWCLEKLRMAAEGVWLREKQMRAALHTAASWPEEGTVEGPLGLTGPREIQGFSLEEEEEQLGEGHKRLLLPL